MYSRWIQGYALVRKVDRESIRWLIVRTGGGQWDLVHGPRRERESLRETATREVSQQLQLDRDSDYLVSTMATLNLEFETILPGETKPKHIIAAFFPVDIYRGSVLDRLDQDPRVLWLSSRDLVQGACGGGAQFNPVTKFLLARFEIVPAWQD